MRLMTRLKPISYGMQKKNSAHFAPRASPTKSFFLDEPTSGLDPRSARHRQRKSYENAVKHGCTVFMDDTYPRNR